MHFQFLIEDASGEILIRQVMYKIQSLYPDISCDYKAFHGIGGYSKTGSVNKQKTGKLLNDLSIYLSGFNKSLSVYNSAIFVVLDNDKRDPQDFKNSLESIAIAQNITIDHVFCLAIEEMEAWLLGDIQALLEAYPSAKSNILHDYVQDSLCGTWELLANAIYTGGYTRLKKDFPSYSGIGKIKCEWAERIGQNMDIYHNLSPSFNFFINEVMKRIPKSA